MPRAATRKEIAANVVLVTIDPLNRTYLSPYGNDWTQTPSSSSGWG